MLLKRQLILLYCFVLLSLRIICALAEGIIYGPVCYQVGFFAGGLMSFDMSSTKRDTIWEEEK